MRLFHRGPRAHQGIALALAACLTLPTLAGCGHSDNAAAPPTSAGGVTNPPPMMTGTPVKPGLTTKQKVVLLAGAALLFYLYKRDVAQNARAASGTAGGKPQLYREVKGPNTGAIYYRDPQTHQPIWVTAPSAPVAVPADQVQQYLPDYQQYQRQPAPTVPTGAQTVPATQYDPSLGSGAMSPPGPGQ